MKKDRITYAQLKLLDSWGGRTERDLERDKDGLYVWMANGLGGEDKVHLPDKIKSDKIKENYD